MEKLDDTQRRKYDESISVKESVHKENYSEVINMVKGTIQWHKKIIEYLKDIKKKNPSEEEVFNKLIKLSDDDIKNTEKVLRVINKDNYKEWEKSVEVAHNSAVKDYNELKKTVKNLKYKESDGWVYITWKDRQGNKYTDGVPAMNKDTMIMEITKSGGKVLKVRESIQRKEQWVEVTTDVQEPKFVNKSLGVTLNIEKKPLSDTVYDYILYKNNKKISVYNNLDDASRALEREKNMLGESMIKNKIKNIKESFKDSPYVVRDVKEFIMKHYDPMLKNVPKIVDYIKKRFNVKDKWINQAIEELKKERKIRESISNKTNSIKEGLYKEDFNNIKLQMSKLLNTLGFTRMSNDIKKAVDKDELLKYIPVLKKTFNDRSISQDKRDQANLLIDRLEKQLKESFSRKEHMNIGDEIEVGGKRMYIDQKLDDEGGYIIKYKVTAESIKNRITTMKESFSRKEKITGNEPIKVINSLPLTDEEKKALRNLQYKYFETEKFWSVSKGDTSYIMTVLDLNRKKADELIMKVLNVLDKKYKESFR